VVARTASGLSVARKVKILYAATGTSNKSPLAFWWWSLLPRSLVHRLSVLFFSFAALALPFSSVFLCGPLPCCRRELGAVVRVSPRSRSLPCRRHAPPGGGGGWNGRELRVAQKLVKNILRVVVVSGSNVLPPRARHAPSRPCKGQADASTAHVNRMKSNYRHHYLRVRR
jgi:hypothetical protein